MRHFLNIKAQKPESAKDNNRTKAKVTRTNKSESNSVATHKRKVFSERADLTEDQTVLYLYP